MFRSANPAKKYGPFGAPQTWDSIDARSSAADTESVAIRAIRRTNVMTMQGTVNKSFFLLALCVITAVVGWELAVPIRDGVMVGSRVNPMMVIFGGLITGFALAMLTCFKPKLAPATAPLYALAEGFFVGGVSAMYASWFASRDVATGDLLPDHTIVLQAALCTFGTFGAMLIAYTTRIIKPTQRFRSVVVTATLGVFILYAASILLRLIGVDMPLLHQASPVGIAISGVIIVIAALNLILDFDYIETGVANGAPKWGEWFGGFTMLVTLVWLYIEFLRLLWMIRTLADD